MREIPPDLVSGFDAVIHLAGESVAGRWTAAKKQRIRDSRVLSTRNLAKAMVAAKKPPQTFVCASAIGYYGNRGDEILTEESASGTGFLAEVSREWEAATQPASEAGIRVANLRTGIVLSRAGGALKQMLLPFRMGVGGKIGSGKQWFSWIHIDDHISAILHILQDGVAQTEASSQSDMLLERRASPPGHTISGLVEKKNTESVLERRASPPGHTISGPVNLTAPNPVTNAEFTEALGTTLGRPTIFSVPAFAVKLAFGEFAEEGLLSSARVEPQVLMRSGFQFQYPTLAIALSGAL
jgi:hypothetical protein